MVRYDLMVLSLVVLVLMLLLLLIIVVVVELGEDGRAANSAMEPVKTWRSFHLTGQTLLLLHAASKCDTSTRMLLPLNTKLLLKQASQPAVHIIEYSDILLGLIV